VFGAHANYENFKQRYSMPPVQSEEKIEVCNFLDQF
jgi:hypothetical protein